MTILDLIAKRHLWKLLLNQNSINLHLKNSLNFIFNAPNITVKMGKSQQVTNSAKKCSNASFSYPTPKKCLKLQKTKDSKTKIEKPLKIKSFIQKLKIQNQV